MLSRSFVYKAVILAGYFGSVLSTYIPSPQNGVQFTQSSSSNHESKSSSSTSTTTFYPSVANQPSTVIKSFPLGTDGVTCEHRRAAAGQANGSQIIPSSPPSSSVYGANAGLPRTYARLAPYDCRVQCSPSTSKEPDQRNCQKLISSMRTSSRDSIEIEPQTWLYVTYQDCAVVFENPNPQNPVVVYDWGRLADQASRLESQCSATPHNSVYPGGSQGQSSGACVFSSCEDKDVNTSYNDASSNHDDVNAVLSSLKDSGIMITFQYNGEKSTGYPSVTAKTISYPSSVGSPQPYGGAGSTASSSTPLSLTSQTSNGY